MAGHELHQALFRSVPADGCRYQAHALPYQFVHGLVQAMESQFFKNPISVSRDELMRLSKIGSVNTYTKCLKELDRYGYVRYEPSYNPHRGSLIYLYSFDKGSETGADTGSEIAVRPYTNNTNRIIVQ